MFIQSYLLHLWVFGWVMFTCVYVCMCMCKCSCMCVCVHEGETLMHVYVNEGEEVLMHVCVHQIQVLMHVCAWRSNVHACVCTLPSSSITSYQLFLIQHLSLNSEITDLAGQRDPGLLLSLLPHFWDYRYTVMPGSLCGSWKSEHRSSGLYGERFADWLSRNSLFSHA